MYKETSKNNSKLFVLIVAMILAYAVLMQILQSVDIAYKSVVQTVFLFILALGVYVCMRFSMTKYEYTITENESEMIFAVVSCLGSVQKFVASVKTDNIEKIAPTDSAEIKDTKEVYRYNARTSLRKSGTYTMVFYDEKNKKSKLIFNPSKKLLKKFESFENIKVFYA